MELLIIVLVAACALLIRSNRKLKRTMQFTFSKPSTWAFDPGLSDQLSSVDWRDVLGKQKFLAYAMASGVFSAVGMEEEGRSAVDLALNKDALKEVAGKVFGALPREVASSPHTIYALDAGMINYLSGYSGGVAVCFSMVSDLIARSSSPEQVATFQQGFVQQAQETLQAGRGR